MTNLHWFPFYWDDYSSKTMHLSQGKHGAFMLLLRWVYTTGKPIPSKQRYSIAQARLKQELADTDAVLGEFFQEISGFWHNLRAEEVMAESLDKHRKFTEAGRAGGLKRASNAQASLKRGSSNYNYNYKDNKKEEVTNISAAPVALALVDDPVLISLPTNKSGENYFFLQSHFDQLFPLFPAVDVPQELRGMAAWLISNPKNAKTASGMPRFINSWLSKVQNRSGMNGASKISRNDNWLAGASDLAAELRSERE